MPCQAIASSNATDLAPLLEPITQSAGVGSYERTYSARTIKTIESDSNIAQMLLFSTGDLGSRGAMTRRRRPRVKRAIRHFLLRGLRIRVICDGSKEAQRASFNQAPGPGADIVRCSTSPRSLGGARVNAAAAARVPARGRPLSVGVRRAGVGAGGKG